MYGYFPFYISMIYHIFRETKFENPSEVFHNDMKICFYGCGPAPELLGFTAYLRDYHHEVRRIKVTFLDQNLWDDWRNYCLTNLKPLFWEGEILEESYKFDLLQYPENVEKNALDAISSATIHNFQNVISDLYKTPENLQKMGPSFFHLYQDISSGSIMILSDQYYGETQRIFDLISQITNRKKFGKTLLKPDKFYNYQREFDNPQLMMDIGHHYKTDMGFYAMVLKRN